MATADHTEAQLIDANQDDNYTDANDGIQRLSRFLAGQATSIDLTSLSSPYDMSTGGNKTVFLENGIIPFSGVLTADMDIYVPTLERAIFGIVNNTTGDFALTVKRGAGDGGIVVLRNQAALLSNSGAAVALYDPPLDQYAEIAAIAPATDYFLVWDASALELKKIKGEDLPGSSGGGGSDLDALPIVLSPADRGAIATRIADETAADYSTAAAVPFDAEAVDTDAIHDTATNNSRVTVPAGVTKVRIRANARISAGTSGEWVRAEILKGGAAFDGMGSDRVEVTDTIADLNAESAAVEVSGGDYFELFLETETDASITVERENTWLAMEIVETTDTVPSLRTVVASLPARWRGGRISKTANQTSIGAGVVEVTWDETTIDTDGIADLANEALVVPAGVSKVRLRAGVHIINASTAGGFFADIIKNDGVLGDDRSQVRFERDAVAGNAAIQVLSPVLSVAEGDFFTLNVQVTADATTDITTQSWYEMEIVEFNSSTDAVQAYIAVPPEHKGALLARTGTHSIPDAAEETLPWQAATYDTSFDPGDDGPAQRFWLGVDTSFVDGDVSVANDEITETAHGYQTGEGPVQLSNSGGALPTGLAAATDYWFIRVGANTYKFATSRANALAGTDVDITAAAGGGTHTVEHETKLIVPAGVAKIRAKGAVEMAAGTTPVNRYLTIHKNGAEVQGVLPAAIDAGDVAGWLHAETNTLEVSEGDVFELIAFQDSSAAVNVNNDVATNFALEIVEESRAITYPGVTVTPPARHARISKSASQTSLGTGIVEATFDETEVDTYSLADLANNALKVPAGVTKVRLKAMLIVNNADVDGFLFGEIKLNDATLDSIKARTLTRFERATGAGDAELILSTPIIDVVVGDSFTLDIQVGADTTADMLTGTWFEMEVVETDENAFPPEPVEFFINGTPGTSDLIFQKVATRRFSLSDDFAGSEAYFETAPSSGALVFDVDRNGVKIGEINFADGVKTATFTTTAAAVEVFDVGDRLGIDSPANLFSAADLSIALWAWRS